MKTVSETLVNTARAALDEDTAARDATGASLEQFLLSRSESLPEQMNFVIVAKEAGTFAGRDWCVAVAACQDLELQHVTVDGVRFEIGDPLVKGFGHPLKILAAERTLLNGLQIACGAATATAQYVARVRQAWTFDDEPPRVLHTRKTPPLLRELMVSAVEAGGGSLHRKNLSDKVLFKENHKAFVKRVGLGLSDYVNYLSTWGLDDAQVEVETLQEALDVTKAGGRHLLLDNFTPAQVGEALAMLPAGLEIEVSGGITLETIASYCLPGVTRISVGSLTRTIRSIDLSLDIVEPETR